MATTAERLGTVETKVAVLDEKIDHLKGDVKEVHDCLDRTRDTLTETLAAMRLESTNQHNELAGKVAAVEKAKDRMMLYGAIGAAFIAGLGWSGQMNIHTIFKFFGL